MLPWVHGALKSGDLLNDVSYSEIYVKLANINPPYSKLLVIPGPVSMEPSSKAPHCIELFTAYELNFSFVIHMWYIGYILFYNILYFTALA